MNELPSKYIARKTDPNRNRNRHWGYEGINGPPSEGVFSASKRSLSASPLEYLPARKRWCVLHLNRRQAGSTMGYVKFFEDSILKDSIQYFEILDHGGRAGSIGRTRHFVKCFFFADFALVRNDQVYF